jgi:hypothetical protein
MTEYYYRMYDALYDTETEPYRIYVARFPILSQTDRTVQIKDDSGKIRRVLKTAEKRYAYPTIELAKASYIIRKKRQKQHAQRTIYRVDDCLELINQDKYHETHFTFT